jgi:hypothetical protein
MAAIIRPGEPPPSDARGRFGSHSAVERKTEFSTLISCASSSSRAAKVPSEYCGRPLLFGVANHRRGALLNFLNRSNQVFLALCDSAYQLLASHHLFFVV